MNGWPTVIQGGMGVAVSSWRLARAVARAGQLGVVSGTALDTVLVRRLQLGDPDGDLRRAFDAFPDAAVAARLWARFFVPEGKGAAAPFATLPMFKADSGPERHQIAALGGFVEVFLAKEGHDGPIGINFLHKIQLPTPATLYGALLAGIDYVLVGAGIPRDIPSLIDHLCRHQPAETPLVVTGAGEQRFEMRFDPSWVVPDPPPERKRPRFLAIVASATLAQALARRAGEVDGFVVEGPTAGGHNAPPRGPLALTAEGEPLYGPRDAVDMDKMRALGLPFWLAGSYGSPEKVRWAIDQGAAGVQVGSAFAFCEESGLDPSLRAAVLAKLGNGGVRVFTDPQASPTGFPFKVVGLEGTLSEADVYEARTRRCDLGYLREIYVGPEGTLAYRCPAEPVDDYVRKGGRAEDTAGRKCICNGLVATVGLGQQRRDGAEPPIMTSGNELAEPDALPSRAARVPYHAADVVRYLLGSAGEEACISGASSSTDAAPIPASPA